MNLVINVACGRADAIPNIEVVESDHSMDKNGIVFANWMYRNVTSGFHDAVIRELYRLREEDGGNFGFADPFKGE